MFQTPTGRTYLDTAAYGLPSKNCVAALQEALAGWETGEASWQDEWEPAADRCRNLFATLIHGEAGDVALIPAVSLASALVASAVPRGGEVLMGTGEFRSLLYPFLVAEGRGALRVRQVEPDALIESIGPATELIAVSHVQSADGRVTDLRELSSAAQKAGALLYVDATHSVGSLPLDVEVLEIDFLACAAYKWLCCPRGVGFLWTRRGHQPAISPFAAGWRSARNHRAGFFYGGPLDLEDGAARFDLSIAWHSWVGAEQSLFDLLTIPEGVRFMRGLGVARAIAAGLGLPVPDGTIVSVPVTSRQTAAVRLAERGIRATVQRERVRVSPHFYNSLEDGRLAVEALLPVAAH